MAEIFEHPFKLVYHMGKSLILNGVEIFTLIAEAVRAYHEDNFFDFGKFIAEALDVVFLKTVNIKNIKDERSYEFLVGFFEGMQLESSLNEE